MVTRKEGSVRKNAKHSLFATPDLDERFVQAVERLCEQMREPPWAVVNHTVRTAPHFEVPFVPSMATNATRATRGPTRGPTRGRKP